jgi:putative glutamine amidotransferase
MKKIIIGLNVDFNEGRHLIGDSYLKNIIAAGGVPLLVPCHQNLKALNAYLQMVKGFVFIGGYDYPPHYYGAGPSRQEWLLHKRRAKADLYLAKQVLKRKLPVLGICGGHQLINIVLGGKLIQHLSNAKQHVLAKHAVEIRSGKILGRLFGMRKIMVNSSHHQAVMPGKLGRGLEPVAFAENGVIEAFESPRYPFLLGLQWHPERMPWQAHAEKIFKALVNAAGKNNEQDGLWP